MARGRPPVHSRDLPTVDNVQPTRTLNGEEAECFERWKSVIKATRSFLPTDGPLLTFAVELDVRKQRAARAASAIDPYEGGRRHPSLTDWDNAHRDLMSILRELGLTPASLKNVNMGGKPSREKSDLDDFLSEP